MKEYLAIYLILFIVIETRCERGEYEKMQNCLVKSLNKHKSLMEVYLCKKKCIWENLGIVTETGTIKTHAFGNHFGIKRGVNLVEFRLCLKTILPEHSLKNCKDVTKVKICHNMVKELSKSPAASLRATPLYQPAKMRFLVYTATKILDHTLNPLVEGIGNTVKYLLPRPARKGVKIVSDGWFAFNDAIRNTVSSATKSILGLVDSTGNAVVHGVESIGDTTLDYTVRPVVNTVRESVKETIKGEAKEIIESAPTMIADILTELGLGDFIGPDIFKRLPELALKILPKLWTMFKVSKGVIGFVYNLVTHVLNDVNQKNKEPKTPEDFTAQLVPQVVNSLNETATNMVKDLGSILADTLPAVGGKLIEETIDRIVDAMHSAGPTLVNVVTNIMNKFIEEFSKSLAQSLPYILEAIQKLVQNNSEKTVKIIKQKRPKEEIDLGDIEQYINKLHLEE